MSGLDDGESSLAGAADGGSAVPAVALMGVGTLSEYLVNVCPLLLDEDPAELQHALKITVNKRVLEDFISDPRNSVLVIRRTILPNQAPEEGMKREWKLYVIIYHILIYSFICFCCVGGKAPVIFSFELQVTFGGPNTTSLAFIKKNPGTVLEVERAPQSQLHVLNLGTGSPFETFHSYVHNTFAPYFRSFVQAQQQVEGQQFEKMGMLPSAL